MVGGQEVDRVHGMVKVHGWWGSRDDGGQRCVAVQGY